MSSQSVATFQGQRITIGQSNDSVEERLGSADWAATSYRMKMGKFFTGYTAGRYTIEWGYWGNPKSLVLWLDNGTVYAIWLVETSRLR